MKEPGELDALDAAGASSWNERLARILGVAVQEQGENPFALRSTDHRTEVTGPDWTGFPVRIAACLSRQQSLELLDWSEGNAGHERALQEDYIEWRVVRDEAGRIQRVELTTELSDYWCDLAAHAPEETRRVVAEFADEPRVEWSAVYGDLDPLAAGVSPKQREEAFIETMLPPTGRSPYNNGTKAICCMVQEFNNLYSLFRLVVAAARPRVVQDPATGRLRCMTAAEAIPLVSAAQEGRSSDPVLVERLNRLAYEGRRIGLDDPVGIYIQDIAHTRLRKPDGSPVPREWFRFSRGRGPESSSDGRARYQRLVVEVPDEAKLCISDLTDVATGQKLHRGGQVAELVQLALFIRVTEAGVVQVDRRPELAQRAVRDPYGCEPVREKWQRFAAMAGSDRTLESRQARDGDQE